MKRREKAAMAGVSLVADVAEHLERTAGPSGQVQANSLNLSMGIGSAVKKNVQATVKLKLQLFPIDESTRKALEMDKLNPHLELILSSRKKICSVLEHLNQKWGASHVASGELMIFPYNVQRENLLNHQRWTRHSLVTAAEIYDMIGSPPVFRLRYGWISHTELQSGSSDINFAAPSEVEEIRRKQALKEQSLPPTEEDKLKKLVNQIPSNHQISETQNKRLKELTTAISSEANTNVDVHNKDFEMHNIGYGAFSKRNEFCEESDLTNMEKVSDQRARKSPRLSAREWADNLTNAAVGGILTEVSDAMDVDCVEPPVCKSSQRLEQIPFSCDSFDAAIAAHISSQNKIGFTEPPPHSSSIWDAEDTCDAFSFRNRTVSNNQARAAGAGLFRTILRASNTKLQDSVENPIVEKNVLENSLPEKNVQENPMDECPSETHEAESSSKDFSSLTDIYWAESLGPLELDRPCKSYSEGLILSDSMSGLNRLLASSLDAFQNCPFIGSDEKRPPSAAIGAQGSVSFAGKIVTGDKAGVQSLV